jgi:hypothetical protein
MDIKIQSHKYCPMDTKMEDEENEKQKLQEINSNGAVDVTIGGDDADVSS